MCSKKAILLLWAAAGVFSTAVAQNNTTFEEFRKGIFNDYDQFRNTILENYDKFLESTWGEYESFKGVSRDPVPKPSAVPRVTDTPPVKPSQKEDPKPVPPADVPKAEEEVPPAAPAAPANVPPAPPAGRPSAAPFRFPFFGMEMQIPSIEFNIASQLTQTREYAVQWRNLEKNAVAGQVLPYMEELSRQYGLNDYLKYELLSAYVRSRFPPSTCLPACLCCTIC